MLLCLLCQCNLADTLENWLNNDLLCIRMSQGKHTEEIVKMQTGCKINSPLKVPALLCRVRILLHSMSGIVCIGTCSSVRTALSNCSVAISSWKGNEKLSNPNDAASQREERFFKRGWGKKWGEKCSLYEEGIDLGVGSKVVWCMAPTENQAPLRVTHKLRHPLAWVAFENFGHGC